MALVVKDNDGARPSYFQVLLAKQEPKEYVPSWPLNTPSPLKKQRCLPSHLKVPGAPNAPDPSCKSGLLSFSRRQGRGVEKVKTIPINICH